MSTVSVKTIRQIYRKLRPNLIVCDFDGTITTRETITPLLDLARKNWTQKEFDGMSKHLKWYKENHAIYEQELLNNLNEYRTRNKNTDWNINDIIPLFKDCDDLDVESLNKLNLNLNYLSKLDLDELSDIFKKYIRLDLFDLLNECMNDDNNCDIKILSHNWSSYSIEKALNGIVARDDIICNELQYDGQLILNCVTSIDKMNCVNEWKNLYSNIMYIGDAWGDFLANCSSDISVWINTEQNQHFIPIVNDKYLMNKTVTDSLFVVDAWT